MLASCCFPGPLDITTPLLLFMFLFGLSMDYEVFLLARIKEEWDRVPATTIGPCWTGITASGPVVTAAAISIGVVFGGFALGELAEVREIGVGMTRRRAPRRHGGPRPAAARDDVPVRPLELVAWRLLGHNGRMS